MNFKNVYQKIYEQWLHEFELSKLTPLSEENFNIYKEIAVSINKVELENENEIQSGILNAYKENLKFLFEDLLKIREIKIMNSALALKEIDLSDLIEAERLLYQNLVATLKGYKKVKALSLLGDQYNLKQAIDIKISEIPSDNVVFKEDKIHMKEEDLASDVKLPVIENEKGDKIEYYYTLIRFIKRTPPLVGVDLKDYGPFEENDVANMPSQNATILLNEKYAEKIDIN
jgi:DNA replication initiation complex subunit (GINS family)